MTPKALNIHRNVTLTIAVALLFGCGGGSGATGNHANDPNRDTMVLDSSSAGGGEGAGADMVAAGQAGTSDSASSAEPEVGIRGNGGRNDSHVDAGAIDTDRVGETIGRTGTIGKESSGTGATGDFDGKLADAGTNAEAGATDHGPNGAPRDVGAGQPQTQSSAKTAEGTFVTPIAGLSYLFQGNGIFTSKTGGFSFLEVDGVASPVEFNIGGNTLGAVVPHACMTPLSLIPGAAAQFDRDNTLPASAIALMRWLLTLDDDGDAANGINITSATHFAIYSMSILPELMPARALIDLDPASSRFGTEENLAAFVALLNQALNQNQHVLASAQQARQYLLRSLSPCHALRYEGIYTTEWENGGVNIGHINPPLDPKPEPFNLVLTPTSTHPQLSGSFLHHGHRYDVSGFLDPASGQLVFERIVIADSGLVYDPKIFGPMVGYFDPLTQTLEIRHLVRISPLA